MGLLESREYPLALKSDAELRQWFADHRPRLDALVEAYRSSVPAQVGFVRNDPEFDEELHVAGQEESTFSRDYPKVVGLLREMNLGVISVENNGDLRVTIGGILDDSVGFIHSALENPPEIDPAHHIWVERVAKGWFLFRTT